MTLISTSHYTDVRQVVWRVYSLPRNKENRSRLYLGEYSHFSLGSAGIFSVLILKIHILRNAKYEVREYKSGVSYFVYVSRCHKHIKVVIYYGIKWPKFKYINYILLERETFCCVKLFWFFGASWSLYECFAGVWNNFSCYMSWDCKMRNKWKFLYTVISTLNTSAMHSFK